MKVKKTQENAKKFTRFAWKIVSNKKAVSGCPSCPAGTSAAFA